MKYVPNLIPEEHRVLKKEFVGNPYNKIQENIFLILLGWGIGLFSLLMMIVFIKSILLILLFGLITALTIPPVAASLERRLKFTLTSKIAYSGAVLLFLFTLVPVNTYIKREETQRQKKQAILAQQKAEELQKQREKQQVKDSFDYYYSAALHLSEKGKKEEAKKTINEAKRFVQEQSETQNLSHITSAIFVSETDELFNKKRYKEALPNLNLLLEKNSSSHELYFKRAICYQKQGEISSAVSDLKRAIELGSSDAEKLHNKINPIKKRVSYYVTWCCDGTTSNAKGRGACSHHGGVCNWNDPVYESYRKY